MKKKITILSIILVIMTFILSGCASLSREVKSIKSDFGGGLDRTVTVYSYDGTEIRSWSGKFDVSESETEVYFDIDGKRVIIHGGVVINEEN